MRSVFPRINRFVRVLHNQTGVSTPLFDIPLDKIDSYALGSQPRHAAEPGRSTYCSPGDYVCALGENPHDYPTLFQAMRAIPPGQAGRGRPAAQLGGAQRTGECRDSYEYPTWRGHEHLGVLSDSWLCPWPAARCLVGHVTLVSRSASGKNVRDLKLFGGRGLRTIG